VTAAPIVRGRSLPRWRDLGDDVEQWRAVYGAFALVFAFDPSLDGEGRWHWQVNVGDRFHTGADCATREEAITQAEAALRELGAPPAAAERTLS
jgi:hypothetical protein